MTFYVLHRDEQRLLTSDRPIVKAGDRDAFVDVLVLLDTLRKLKEQQQDAAETAASEAHEHGLAEGLRAGKEEFAQAIASLALQVAQHQDRIEQEIASLAVAALRLMVAAIGDEAMLAGITRRAVAAVATSGPILVEASPAMRPAVEQALGVLDQGPHIKLHPDPALSDRQCRITAPDSRIIADLDVQLDAIARRLEGAHVD